MSKLALQVGALCLAAFAAGAVRAQNPPQPAGPPGAGQDSVMMPRRWQRPGGQMNQQRRDELMPQIQERFAQRVQAQLALTDQQMDRLRAEMSSDRDQHRQLQDHEQDMRRAIGDKRSIALSLNNLGLVYQDSGQFKKALTAFEHMKQRRGRNLSDFVLHVP